MNNAYRFALALIACVCLVGSAVAQSSADSSIDIKEIEESAPQKPAEKPAPPQQQQPAQQQVIAPIAPKSLLLIPQPNPAPLQWVPNSSPKDSELLDSYPYGAAFTVSGIAQQGNAYVAIVEYKGSTFVVQPGTMVPDQDDPAFQVRAITSTRVEAFDPVMRRLVRRSLPPMASRF
jgi:Tfp pilus assembly protein PilP